MLKFVRLCLVTGCSIAVAFGLTLFALNQPSTAALLAKPTPTPKAFAQPDAQLRNQLRGLVVDANGPVAGATVRVHLTEQGATTDQKGAFTIRNLAATDMVTLTAWAEGYYIAWTRVDTGDKAPVKLQLNPYFTTDNVKYNWFEQDGVEVSAACGVCHKA